MILVLTENGNVYNTSATELNKNKYTYTNGWHCDLGENVLFVNTKKAAVGEVNIRASVCPNKGKLCTQKLCWCPTDVAIPKAKNKSWLDKLYDIDASLNYPIFNFDETVMAYGGINTLKNNALHIDWTIIKQCNYDCSYCPPNIHDNIARYSSFVESKPYVEDALSGYKLDRPITITISGGEPTLHPDIEEFLIYAKSITDDVIVLTNGTANKQKMLQLEKYCRFLITLHHEYVNDKFMDKIIDYLKESKANNEIQLMDAFDLEKNKIKIDLLKELCYIRTNKPIVNKLTVEGEYDWI